MKTKFGLTDLLVVLFTVIAITACNAADVKRDDIQHQSLSDEVTSKESRIKTIGIIGGAAGCHPRNITG